MVNNSSNPLDKYKCPCGLTFRLQYNYSKHLKECPLNPKKPRKRQGNDLNDYYIPTKEEND